VGKCRKWRLRRRRTQEGGWADGDIKILPHDGRKGDKTVSMVARWKGSGTGGKPILILAHMDVVEAKRADWKEDPFAFIEKDGYFYGTRDERQ
jgi:acetylornithine deacetylase/succinyl-diaminopimelate desuccinylase-like protein